MTRRHPALPIVLVGTGLIVACQAGSELGEDRVAAPTAAADQGARLAAGVPEPTPGLAQIDWTSAGDCLDTLWLLHAAAREGRLDRAERPPITVVTPDMPPAPGWYQATAVPVAADLPLEMRDAAAAAGLGVPCVVQIERPYDQRAEHRVLGQEVVRSLYQSGVRSEKNPDYQVAEARLRQAERQLKDDVPDIISVGDPLLDLVGVVVGGVLGAFSRGSSSGEVDQALAELAATPRSIDRPVYRPYHFEQTIVLGQKEATIPIALVDHASGNIVRTELRHREIREFNLLEDLDARDRDYPQHRAASVTQGELERWLDQPPELPLSTVVAALLDVDAGAGRDTQIAARSGTVGPGAPRSALAPLPNDAMPRYRTELPDEERWPDSLMAEDEAGDWRDLEPAAGPELSAAPGLLHEHPARAGRADRSRRRPPDAAPRQQAAAIAAGDPRRASVVEIAAQERSGSGFYVLPDLVLTTYQLVRDQLVVDVTTFEGALVPGLVARTDPARDLALVQVPKPGAPVILGEDRAAGAGRHVVALGQRRGLAPSLTPARLASDDRGGGGGPAPRTWLVETDEAAPELAVGSPLFLGEQVIGMTIGLAGAGGPRLALPASALLDFLKDDRARLAGAAPRP